MLYRLSPFFTVYVNLLLVDVVGISNFWPIERVLLVKLFFSFKAFTVVLNLFAILYKESPFTTVYSVSFSDGIFFTYNFWPIDSVFDVKLFIFFSSSTVKLYFLDIWYRVSPLFTVYISVSI